jgi:aminopeptidase N
MRRLLVLLLASASGAFAHDALDTQHIRLELSVDDAGRRITGRAIETIRLPAALETLELDAVGLEVQAVHGEDGRSLGFEKTRRSLRIRLDPKPPPGGTLTLTIDYTALPRRGVYFVGPGPRRPKLARQVWTNSWPEDARYWFPCHDDLADKTTSELVLTLPKDWQAMANGALVETTPSGKTRAWHWRMDEPHSTYLLAFVAGEYEEVRDEDPLQRVPLSYFVYRGRADDARKTFGQTGAMLRFYEAETGLPYPYPKFAQAVAADFVFGGMENVSAVTLSDSALLGPTARLDTSSDAVIAHELAHQWWGDTVSPAGWADVWLSEGFATFLADRWQENAEGEDAASYTRLRSADAWFALDPEDRQRPVAFTGSDDPNALLNANVYEKGSLVLGMLRHMLGDEAFRRGTQSMMGRFAFRSATTEDLERALEQAAGHELAWFFDQWLRKPGAPDLALSWRWDAEGSRVVLSVHQAESVELPARVFQLPVDVVLVAADGSQRKESIFVERAEQDFSIPSTAAPRSVLFDSGSYIPKRLRFDKALDELVFDLASGPTAADRALAARALAERGGDTVVAALAAAVQRERFWGVRVEAGLALGRLRGPSVVAALRSGARDSDPRVREAVMKAMGDSGSPEVASDLFAALASDPSERVQGEALRSLGALRARGAFEALTKALARDSHAERIRIAALEGLARFGGSTALPLALEQAAEGRALGLRTAAVRVLGELGRGQGVVLGRLQRLLDDPQPRVRRAAAEALGSIGDAASLRALGEAGLREDVPAVRRAIDTAAAALAAPRPAVSPVP